MPSVREIKRRIQSVKNISQVTRALEAVSASKARRAQQQAERSRPYAEKAWEILVNLSGQAGGVQHPLLTVHENVKNIDIVLITSDRGLAGAYNMNIIRHAEAFAAKIGVPVRWITIGRKGRDYLVRRRHNVIADFSRLPAAPSVREITPASELIVNDFLGGESQQVFLAYTDFINVLSQRPAVVQLLPLMPAQVDMVAKNYIKPAPEQTIANREYIYEPGARAILDEIVPRFTALQIYQAVLESFASEHAARMVAMRNASENGAALADDLTLEYNKARQLAITSEILDIVGGVEALKGNKKKLADHDHFESERAEGLLQKAAHLIADVTAMLKGSDERDDLRVIEGIGPQVERALQDAGVNTYAQLATMDADELIRIVKTERKVRIVGSPASWVKQAQLLVEKDMAGLKEYQDRLKGGREVEA